MPLDSGNPPWVPPFPWSPSGPRRPAPATYLAPKPNRPELIVDQWRVLLADKDNNIIGLGDGLWGQGTPLARNIRAKRSGTRAL